MAVIVQPTDRTDRQRHESVPLAHIARATANAGRAFTGKPSAVPALADNLGSLDSSVFVNTPRHDPETDPLLVLIGGRILAVASCHHHRMLDSHLTGV
jgi:hypothetical protein